MLWLDLERLILSLLKPGQRLDGITYFTARVRNDPVAVANQHTYLNALAAACLRVTVQFGRFQEKRWACRTCGATWRSYEEKETDVGIAVALVEAAATKSYEVALLVSADSDLSPAVRAARRLHPAGRLIAVFPPNRQSPVLARQVDASFRLGDARIRAAQLPDVVIGRDGRVQRRPSAWSG
jgi:NYN domain